MDANFALRTGLTTRLAQLERHLREIESDRRRVTNPLDRDWEDQGPTRQHDAVLDKLAAGDRQQIAAIRAALTRMAQGTYGICRTCEAPITPQRLTALPYATQCLVCATQAERQGGKFRAYGTNGSS